MCSLLGCVPLTLLQSKDVHGIAVRFLCLSKFEKTFLGLGSIERTLRRILNDRINAIAPLEVALYNEAKTFEV